MNQILIRLRDETKGLAFFVAAAVESDSLKVAGSASDAEEAVALARDQQPDLMVLDLDVLDGDVTVIDLVHEAAPRAKIVVVSGQDPTEHGPDMFTAGAHGVAQRIVSPPVLIEEAVALVTEAACSVAAQLAPAVTSPGDARRLASRTIERWGRDDLQETVRLLVSEVVTNAIQHGEGDIEMAIRLTDAGVRVEVHDTSAVLPAVAHRGIEAPTGRGLAIVETLASRWGARTCEVGKSVWFEVGLDDVPADRPASPG
jgi:DNA-binding NarL/FixJ family response regulator